MIEPFRIATPSGVLDDLAARLRATRLLDSDGDWNVHPRGVFAWAGRFFNVTRWTEMPSGGHFAALEEPQRLAEELRAFYRALR